MSNPHGYGPPGGYPPGQGPGQQPHPGSAQPAGPQAPGHQAPGPMVGSQAGGPMGGAPMGGPQGPMGGAPYGAPQQQPGWGVPQQPMGPPHLQQPPYGGMMRPPGLMQPPGDAMPAWARIIARVSLGIGVLLLLATIVGGISSESLGVGLAQLTGAPLGFGIVATALTQKHARGGPGKPIGIGCLVGFALSAFIAFFFAAIWPSL